VTLAGNSECGIKVSRRASFLILVLVRTSTCSGIDWMGEYILRTICKYCWQQWRKLGDRGWVI